MNISLTESDLHQLNELRELLDLAPPAQLREVIQDLYFTCLIELDYDLLRHPKDLTAKVYGLIRFFDELEKAGVKNSANP